MIEVGMGVLFAILFVTAYLVVSRLFAGGEHGRTRWREIFHSSKAIEAKQPKLFLTNGAMREHHSGRAEGRSQGK
jgi:hypothetical protein